MAAKPFQPKVTKTLAYWVHSLVLNKMMYCKHGPCVAFFIVMLSVILMSVEMLNVVMLNVVAPSRLRFHLSLFENSQHPKVAKLFFF